jgi:glucose/arabinose dehydrogenase
VVKNGALLTTPFLTVTVNADGERGLLGIAFDPAFSTNSHVYVYYTATTPTIHNRLSRFTANGDVAVAGSEVVLLDLPTLGATNHNGGAIHFGPDSLLYVAVGENAVGSNAQTLSNPLGKILRINRDGSIPATNPFFGEATGINRAIWALGLRNPFTFAFEPGTGRMMINDVGAATYEEINEGQPGANYGWPSFEGPFSGPGTTPPIYAYPHSSGACAISGGAFYPLVSPQFPAEYQGDYFFADFCAGWIRRLDFVTGVDIANFGSGISMPVDLAVGPEGSLYYLARGSGANTGVLVRVDSTSLTPPIPTEPVGELPRPRILTPSARTLFTGGGLLEFSGAASDPEDGPLHSSRFVWEIFFHTGSQATRVAGPSSGSIRGAYRVPDTGNTSVDVFYRIQLTVSDSDGNQVTTFRDLRPRVTRVTLASTPPGLAVSLDGETVATPYSFLSVVGMKRTVSASATQAPNGVTYSFRAWSNGGARAQTLTVPAGSTTLRVLYGRPRGTPTAPPRQAVPR